MTRGADVAGWMIVALIAVPAGLCLAGVLFFLALAVV